MLETPDEQIKKNHTLPLMCTAVGGGGLRDSEFPRDEKCTQDPLVGVKNFNMFPEKSSRACKESQSGYVRF